jgi:membrane protease YdiL (CAAX protease family)
VVSFVTLLGTFLTIWLMMKFADEKPFYTLGFKNHEIGKDMVKGIFLGFIIMFLGFAILYFTNQIQIQKIDFDVNSFFAGLFVFIFVSITEEVLVRGYILKNLLASFNNYIALFISAVIFSILHLGNPFMDFFSFVQLILAGILLGIPYVMTRKLWFSIALHFSWNFFQGTIFGFNVSGNQQYSIIQTKFNTATIWNGGYFGFEGSVLCLLFQLMAIFFVWMKYREKELIKLNN